MPGTGEASVEAYGTADPPSGDATEEDEPCDEDE